MSISIKSGNRWHEVTNFGAQIGSTWHATRDNKTFLKVGGVWKQVLPSLLYTVTDTFSRSATTNGLGASETGNQTWTNVSGNWFVNSSQKAQANVNSIATVEMNDANVAISLDVDPLGAVGPAFWVVDANNWWGVMVWPSTTTQTQTTCIQTGQVCVASHDVATPGPCLGYTSVCANPVQTQVDCNGGYGGGFQTVCDTVTQTQCYDCNDTVCCDQVQVQVNCHQVQVPYVCTDPVYVTTCPSGQYVNQCTGGHGPGGTTTVCDQYNTQCIQTSTTTTNVLGHYYLQLLSSVNGTLSTPVQAILSGPANSLSVAISGNNITLNAYSGTGQTTLLSSQTYTAASPATSTKHGLLLAPGGFTQGSFADNITIAPN